MISPPWKLLFKAYIHKFLTQQAGIWGFGSLGACQETGKGMKNEGGGEYLQGKIATNSLTKQRTSIQPQCKSGAIAQWFKRCLVCLDIAQRVFQKIAYVCVVPRTSIILFAGCTSGGPPTYVRTRDMGVRSPDLAYVHLQRVSVCFYFLMDQSVVRLTLRVLGLVKTILLKTFVDHFYGKDFKQ